MPDSLTAYIIVVLFIATLIRSTFGFGEAMVAVPLLALRAPMTVAAPLAVIISIFVASVIILQDWRHIQLRSAAGLMSSAFLGIPLGILLLAKGNEHLIKSILGAIIISFSLYALVGKRFLHMRHDHWVWLIGCGFLSGIMGGAYGMNGPPLVVYAALQKWSPQHFRATLQGYFLPASCFGLFGYVSLGLWKPAITHYALVSLPAVVIAILIGRAINIRLKGSNFFRFVYAGLIVIGSVLLYQAIAK